MNKRIITLCLSAFLCVSSFAQVKTSKPDLSKENNLYSVNRKITISTDSKKKTVVHLGANEDPGVAWIKDLKFSTGTIEFDIKGKDVLQQSFVGIAFNGINDSTYEGIYFRPFNFQSSDTLRRNHSVQYIFQPKYDWYYLRENFPGIYESHLTSKIDPNNWFHARVVVDDKMIKVFVNEDKVPSLSVQRLTSSNKGGVGFWVGNESEGDFADLILQHK